MSVTLREQRAKLVKDWRDILDKAEKEERGLSVDEKSVVEKIEADIDAIKARVEAQEKLEKLEQEERAIVPESQRQTPRKETAEAKPADLYRKAFWHMVRTGEAAELRSHTVGTDTRGGYTVPDEFRAELIQALEEANVMRQIARVITSSSGTLSVPKVTTHGTAAWTTEEAAYTETN